MQLLALGARRLLVPSLLHCAAAARASANIKKVEDEVRVLVIAQEMQANMLSTERQKLLQLEVDARVMLRRGHSVQRQRLTSIAMRVSGPSARRLDFVCIDSVLLPYSCCHFLEDALNFACSPETA